MTKKFKIHGTTMVISKQDKNQTFYKVELKDSNGITTVIYERSFNDAVLYATEWEKMTETRKKLHDLETDAIEAMIEEDRKRGTILSLD